MLIRYYKLKKLKVMGKNTVKNLGKLTLAVIATCLILTPLCQSGTVLTQTEWNRPHGAEGIHAWFDRRYTRYELFLRDSYDFDYGDPTPAEQAHLEAINRARANPMMEAARLGIDLYEGVPADAISGLPVQPLVMNAKLLSAARLHSQDMIDHDYFAHASLDGTSPFVRMENAGYDYSMAGENLAFIGSTIEMNLEETTLALHDNLFVDEGYPDRGHRVNMLVEGYKEVGVGLILGEFRGYDYSYMLSCDFGTPRGYTGSFILGVVYDDRNSDNFFTMSEKGSLMSIST